MKKSPLDAVALAYISLEDEEGDLRDRLLRPVTIEIPLSKYESRRLSHGDEMSAWRYNEVQGTAKPGFPENVQVLLSLF